MTVTALHAIANVVIKMAVLLLPLFLLLLVAVAIIVIVIVFVLVVIAVSLSSVSMSFLRPCCAATNGGVVTTEVRTAGWWGEGRTTVTMDGKTRTAIVDATCFAASLPRLWPIVSVYNLVNGDY
jgi:hypothetical protein